MVYCDVHGSIASICLLLSWLSLEMVVFQSKYESFEVLHGILTRNSYTRSVKFLFCIQAVLYHASLNFVYVLPIGKQLPQKCTFVTLLRYSFSFQHWMYICSGFKLLFVIFLGLLCCTWCLTNGNEFYIMFSVFTLLILYLGFKKKVRCSFFPH